ncbi:uroporphyrinogen-III synthase [Sphingomonas quercus]|uniref:Uroporphyrinogen-III synthase n=1 Tax=Sphingomonas quercus TaxID=2842451 RepID=A0ABS6BKM3_9SPHN|nr:uroporphyrinogen-III synthase [Sphingomonas quercus]MBU3078172.1 uroporphyrinogen-III synthase [Sphingomonas quercus]
MTTVLVLRPEPGATASAARAEAAGFRAVTAPLFTIAPVDWAPPTEPVDALMLTSANAVRHGGPALALFHDLPVHAVGIETAAIASAAGFRDVRIGPGDAAGLVAALPDGLRVLHLAGREHRPALPAQGLRRIVYAADPVTALPDAAREALAGGAIALLHSARAAATFAALVETAGLSRAGIAVAALSPAVAAAAGIGWRRCAIAGAPDDEALFRAANCR